MNEKYLKPSDLRNALTRLDKDDDDDGWVQSPYQDEESAEHEDVRDDPQDDPDFSDSALAVLATEDLDEDEEDTNQTVIKPGVVLRSKRAVQAYDDEEDVEDEPEPEPAPKRKPKTKTKKGARTVATKKRASPSKTLDEIPRQELLSLQEKGHTHVKLVIKRQNPGGTWSTIRTVNDVPITGLFDLRGPVTAMSGGGKFVYTVLSSQTREQIAPRWSEIYDGRQRETPEHLDFVWDEALGNLKIVPKSASYGIVDSPFQTQAGVPGVATQGMAPPQPGVRGPLQTHPLYQTALASGPQPQIDPRTGRAVAPPPPGLLPTWMHGYSADAQWAHVLEKRIEQLESEGANAQKYGGGMASPWVHHEIRQSGEHKAELSAVRTQLHAVQQQTQEKIETLRREYEQSLEREKEARVRAEKDLERERADAKLEVLRQQIEGRKSNVDYAALLAAGAPILSALITSRTESQKLEKSSFLELLATTNKKDPSPLTNPEFITAIATVAVPLITKVLESNGPQAQAEVMQLEHEQRMMHLKMMADMIASSVPDESPWKQVLDQAIGMFGTVMANRQLAAPQQPRGLPSGQPTQQTNPLVALIQEMKRSEPEAGADVEQIFARVPPALGFHTVEWAHVMYNIHTRLEVSEMATIIVDRVIECDRYGMLPQPLAQVFEQPEQCFRTVLSPLPINAKDSEYVDNLIAGVLQEMEERGLFEEAEETAPEPAVTVSEAVPDERYAHETPGTPSHYVPQNDEDAVIDVRGS